MHRPRHEQILSLVLAVAGNLFLARMFFVAFLDPSAHEEFMQKTGMLLFLIEFFSIHSSGMLLGKGVAENKPAPIFLESSGKSKTLFFAPIKFVLLFIYLSAMLGLGLAFKSWQIPFIFFVGLLSKYLGTKSIEDRKLAGDTVGLSFLFYLFFVFLALRLWPALAIFFVILAAAIIRNKAKPALRERLPAVILAAFFVFLTILALLFAPSGDDAGRRFVLLFAGYYASLALGEVLLFVQNAKQPISPSDIRLRM